MSGICEENMALYPSETDDVAPAILVEEKMTPRVISRKDVLHDFKTKHMVLT